MAPPSAAGYYNARLGLFFLWLALTNATTPTPMPTLSGCDVCATSGDCSHAYLNTPGQLCAPWLDQNNQKRSCCCPNDAVCKNDNYDCRCSRVATPAPTESGDSSTSFIIPTGSAVAAFVILSLAACYCFKRAKRPPPNQATARPPVVGTGVPGVNVVPMAQPVVYAPQAGYNPYAMAPTAPVYSYGNEYHHHHHDGGSSAVVGAVAGIATGMVIADVVSDGFGGGGYDGGFSGDTGGYSGGYDGGGGGGGGFDGGGADSGGGGGDFGRDF